MATIRERAEAEAWERRRVLRAFVAGDAAPSRGDGPSLWRCLLGGAALAIVLLAGVVMVPSWIHP
ncbi:hypothetical protein [Nocardioides jiangxiensis]|uniref:Uncharacterized protein n=1 Tax=Nocardioides jiangxiensis TaxID=3064524 RepID=A0ABT9AWM9_9ACTN|nr:hypothetical protein [Nocardioides sp. WY-20]MDO7866861.1 hypothetical protein [Nocardioides sp. WY-20]